MCYDIKVAVLHIEPAKNLISSNLTGLKPYLKPEISKII